MSNTTTAPTAIPIRLIDDVEGRKRRKRHSENHGRPPFVARMTAVAQIGIRERTNCIARMHQIESFVDALQW